MALAPVELGSIPGELYEADALLDVVLVRLLVPLDPGADLGLFLAPCGDVPALESLLDLPIQLVHVNLFDAVLELGVAGVQLLDGAAVERRLLLLALPQALPQPVEQGGSCRTAKP